MALFDGHYSILTILLSTCKGLIKPISRCVTMNEILIVFCTMQQVVSEISFSFFFLPIDSDMVDVIIINQ